MVKVKSIFLTHKEALVSEVTGGVQLCSQEFHYVLEQVDEIELINYYVPYTRNLVDRVRIKTGIENYSMFNVDRDAPDLLHYITKNNIQIVFINMASLIRFAKPIKQAFGQNN